MSAVKKSIAEREAEWAEYRAKRKAFDASNEFYPCIRMCDFIAQPRPPVIAYCPPFVFADCMTIMAADPKEGKSTMFFHIVEAIAEGKSFQQQPCEQSKVLYISEQNDGSLHEQTARIEKLKTVRDVFVLPIDYNRRKVPVMVKDAGGMTTAEQATDDEGKPAFKEIPIGGWDTQVQFWGEMLLKTGARVIVVDTLISFSQLQNGESYDAGEMTALLTKLKTLYSLVPGLAIVVLCHCRKLSGSKYVRSFADIAGSYAIRAVSDMNILLFAKDKRDHPRQRTYVIEGRFSEYTTGEEGITVELSKDGSEFTPVATQAAWTIRDTRAALRSAFDAEPSLLKLGRDALAARFAEIGATPAIARVVKQEYLATAGGSGEVKK